MIPGSSQEPLTQRLLREMASRLADRLGCCPIHQMTLICPMCDVTWTGSAREHVEVEGLAEQSLADGDEVRSPWHCDRCGAEALCAECYEAAYPSRQTGLSAEDEVRLYALCQSHLVITVRGRPIEVHDEREPHGGRESS